MMLKKIDKEVLFGGIFGVLAILATLGEMIANGLSAATVLGAVKDISGTVVAVMVFVVAVRHLFVKKATDFDGTFKAEMEKVINKYSPILTKDLSVTGRYNIASNLDAILGKETGAYHTVFEMTNRTEISFHISKTVFMGRSKESFEEKQQGIATRIGAKLQKSFERIQGCETTAKGLRVCFDGALETNDDAVMLAEIVDCVILLYLVEYKKA